MSTPKEWVVDTLRRAARAAMARWPPDVATRMLQRALEEPPPTGQAQLLAELGQAQFTSGAMEDCLSTFERVLGMASDPGERTAIRLTEAIALLTTAGPEAAVR